jgi:hypothetical protein
MDLVTLAQARRHLRLSEEIGGGSPPSGSPPSAEDEDLQLKIDQATEIILDYIERPADAVWTAEIASWDSATVPGSVQAAILLQVGQLWRFRGDDQSNEQLPASEHGYLALGVTALLHRFRDPALA